MKVVSDSSPLIALARIDRLHLLRRLYPSVSISREVHNEVVIAGAGLPGASQVGQAEWIEVVPLQDTQALTHAIKMTGLGRGEMSSILLAKEIEALIVLMDERKGRRYAVAEGLSVIGCIGILEILYRRRELDDLRGAYLQLLNEKVRLDPSTIKQSLAKFNLLQ